ncbi:hypothetical protein LPJ66_008054 [Kickxella alabastrina]|uniref:Uncharacterized protein n=1 Tax=Kickxella alabastrina TaxID=61397 RepID=A0ACC1I9G7_9FUNG|nr:hypothetical protein LPJ66_008054 [Kickxella alabastrina]
MYGNRISLISKSQIRYNGILHDVDEAEQTISLEQVSSMGTEGRRGNSVDEIPASKDIYEYIQFRATDVLSVQFETDPVTPVKAQPPPPNDPAVLEVGPKPVSHAQRMQAAADRNAAQAQAESPAYASVVVAPVADQQDAVEDPVTDTESVSEVNERQQGGFQRRQGGYNANNNTRGGYIPRGGRGGYSNQNRRGGYQGRGGYQPRHGRRVEIPESDFDFESSNSKLNKDELAKEFSKLNVQVDTIPTPPSPSSRAAVATPDATVAGSSSAQAADGESVSYTPKKSFFDDISCEAKERLQMQEQGLSYEEKRGRIHAERQQNFETFGQTAADLSRFRYNRYHPGGGRGGATGGYFNANGVQNNPSNANGGWRGGRGGRGGFNRVDGHNTNNYRGGYTHHNSGQRGNYNGSSGHYQQQQQQQNAESSS